MNFVDFSGLDQELSKKVFYKFHKMFNQTTEDKADIAICGPQPIDVSGKKSIKYIVCNMTNTDHIIYNDITSEKKQTMISLKGEQEFIKKINSVAEHTIYLMLSLLKRKNRNKPPGHTLANKTLGIIGYGRVGKKVSDLAGSMQVNICHCDTLGETTKDYLEKLFLIFSKSDIITLHVSFNKGDTPLIGVNELELIRDGTYIINTSRPGVVDNAAVEKHIDRLGGLASDFRLPVTLEHRENVFITEHTGGYTIEDLCKTADFCYEKLTKTVCDLEE